MEHLEPHRRIGLAVIAALTLVAAGGLVSSRWESTPAASRQSSSAPTPARPLASPDSASQIACLDLPVSSAVLVPQSCWLTGPTSALLVGSVPGDSSEGAIVIIQGQAQSLAQLPSSGALQVTEVNPASACVKNAKGEFRTVDLYSGTVSSAWAADCALTAVTGAAPTPSVTAPDFGASGSAQNAPAVASTVGVAPSVTPSYYEYNAYYSECTTSPNVNCPLYRQGASAHPPPHNGLLVLDFGSPCFVPNSSPVVYGVEMFFVPTCIPDSSLQPLVENWISGYESQNSTSTVNLTLAIGTSNSYNGVDTNYALTNAEMTASGQSWYQNLVGAISTSGLNAPLTIWGANDMEQSSDNEWYPGPPTVAWVQGFDSASPAVSACPLGQPGYLADYGDDVLGGSGSADGWTVQQVYQVAWALPAACALPEIYFSDMAAEWQALSQWAVAKGYPAIEFSGVMTEVESGTLSPNEAWAALESDTGQSPAIPSVTTISWTLQNLPQVSSVSPAQGPAGGGTQVEISGANLSGAEAVDFGVNPAPSFTVTGANSISAAAPAGSPGYVDVTVQTAVGTSAPAGGDGFIYTAPGAYHPLTPARIEDTRPGSELPGSGDAPGPGQVLTVQVTGRGGIPSSGVAAVVANVTITGPTAPGLVSVYPSGVAVPLSSTMDFLPNQTKAELTVVALGRNGQISIYNANGSTQIIIDVEGWYDSTNSTSGAGLYNPLPPARIADTRPGTGTPYSGETLGPSQSMTVQVAGAGGVPSSGAQAVVLNVTGVDATAGSSLLVFPTGSGTLLASTVNLTPGEAVPNQDIVELGSGGALTVVNQSLGSVDVILDVAGWYTDGGTGATFGSTFTVMVPTRVVDTRTNSGEPDAGETIPAFGTLPVQLVGEVGIPTQNATGVVVNATVTNTQAAGDFAAWPDGHAASTTSELNWVPGQTTENAAVIGLGTDGALDFQNQSTGSADLVLDLSGWFTADPLDAAPIVNSVSPAQGPAGGGTTVQISGANLSGATAVDFGANPAASFAVNSANSISATSSAGSLGYVDITVRTAVGTSAAAAGDGFLYTAPGAYHPLTPARIEDTRPAAGLPGSGEAPGPGGVLTVQVTGQGGVPSSGVSAVVANVTITSPTETGMVSVYPAGVALPLTSTMDFLATQTKADLAEVAVGRNGQISIYNSTGWTQIIVDVEGWYDSSGPTSGAGLYNPLPPARIADTRPGTGTPYSGDTLGPHQSMTVQVAGAGGVPSSGAEAVVLNVTGVDASAGGPILVFPAGAGAPLASTVNVPPGAAIPNQDTVELGTGGALTVLNQSPGSVDVILDVAGWYTDGAPGANSGSTFNVLVPTRVADTRANSGEPYAGETISSFGTLQVQLAGVAGIPTHNATGVVVNATATNTQAAGDFAVWPAGQAAATTSQVNWGPGQTTENAVVLGLGTSGALDFQNQSTGSADLILDLSGWFGAG